MSNCPATTPESLRHFIATAPVRAKVSVGSTQATTESAADAAAPRYRPGSPARRHGVPDHGRRRPGTGKTTVARANELGAGDPDRRRAPPWPAAGRFWRTRRPGEGLYTPDNIEAVYCAVLGRHVDGRRSAWSPTAPGRTRSTATAREVAAVAAAMVELSVAAWTPPSKAIRTRSHHLPGDPGNRHRTGCPFGARSAGQPTAWTRSRSAEPPAPRPDTHCRCPQPAREPNALRRRHRESALTPRRPAARALTEMVAAGLPSHG